MSALAATAMAIAPKGHVRELVLVNRNSPTIFPHRCTGLIPGMLQPACAPVREPLSNAILCAFLSEVGHLEGRTWGRLAPAGVMRTQACSGPGTD
jgi:hypothetical protein